MERPKHCAELTAEIVLHTLALAVGAYTVISFLADAGIGVYPLLPAFPLIASCGVAGAIELGAQSLRSRRRQRRTQNPPPYL